MFDFRSDTVTRPTAGMLDAMRDARVGDDVFGDDPTVNQLQDEVARRLGFEAGLFLPSGTQSNLCALMAHCQRGDEYIVGQQAHTYKYEGGGAAVLGSIQPQPIEHDADGSLNLGRIAAAIKPDDPHFARTRLVCIENTFGGRALPMAYLPAVRRLTAEYGLGLHLDGARVFNAAVFHGVDAVEITRHVDSVSVCFSKGLGAPVGSVLVGDGAFIARAHRWRKMLGGGMRQAGGLAAACLYALDHHVTRLADDHRRAVALTMRLSEIPGVDVDTDPAQTNMVFMRVGGDPKTLEVFLAERGVMIRAGATIRLVTHLDITDAAVDALVEGVSAFMRDRLET